MIKCSEIYNPDLIFATDGRSPIIKLSLILHEEGNAYSWVNSELMAMFTHDSEGGADAWGNGDTISIEYLLNRQDKYFSPLFERLLQHYGSDYLSLAQRISVMIINKFLKGWSKLADAVFSDYNPIENYNMKENRSTLLEEVTNTENEETVTNKYSGFNADEMKDVSESSTDGSIDTTKTTTGGKTNNELTRSGNIGVTTSQQMIESSYNLAKKKILDLIYRDIDTILFIDYYN